MMPDDAAALITEAQEALGYITESPRRVTLNA
jgi:hypothetical protein